MAPARIPVALQPPDIQHSDTMYAPEPVWGVPRLAGVIGHLRTLQDLCNTLGIPFVEFPNPTNPENSND